MVKRLLQKGNVIIVIINITRFGPYKLGLREYPEKNNKTERGREMGVKYGWLWKNGSFDRYVLNPRTCHSNGWGRRYPLDVTKLRYKPMSGRKP